MSDVQVSPGDLPELDATQQRLLGSLLEKELTVPASYPLTLNAVRSASNQASSREPILDLDESSVRDGLRELKRLGLVRVVWADTGRRTMKYLQTLTEVLDLSAAERALLTVLLLRGAQPAGALRPRTERLHAFTDRAAVETTLAGLAARTPALVRSQPRRPGQQDERWVHLLGPVPSETAAAQSPTGVAGSAADLESVLSAGAAARDHRVRASYEAVASAYAARLSDELDDLPFERWLLERVAQKAAGGPVVDAGCGPGHVSAYLADLGANVSGVDLSEAMIDQARQRFGGLSFEVGDLRSLVRPSDAAGWSAVLAWYSLIYLAPSELPGALGALTRPMQPGGLLVLALHAGAEVCHLGEWFEAPVDLDVVLSDPTQVLSMVAEAGLVDVEWHLRGPITRRGETTQRLYVLARTPGSVVLPDPIDRVG